MLWRFLDTGVRDAPWNMAIDEALLLSCDEQPKVTLRFYGWARPTLSLGYFQGVASVDLEECQRRGFEWIRRPTGGRAVLHHHELTYSIIAPIEVLGGSVTQSHEKISRALARGLEKLGLHAEFAERAGPHPRPLSRRGEACFAPATSSRRERGGEAGVRAACFAAPALVELTVKGKKVIGSAQVRTKKSLLQHGSIPITIDFEALAAALGLSTAARLLRQKAAGLADFLARELTIEELKQALIKGFEEIFEAKFRAEGLSSQERALAERLCTEKYSTCAWNRRA